MLIGARDEDGTARVFSVNATWASDVTRSGGVWKCGYYGLEILSGPDAEPFCRDIPPGEKREIDLEKSVIVHVAPKKTAVQELVEASQNFRDGLFSDGGRRVGLTEFERRSHALESALARVRQEGGV